MPSYTPDLIPHEGAWSLLKRTIANFAPAGLASLTRNDKCRLNKI